MGEHKEETVVVLDIEFENDAPVLAWSPKGKRPDKLDPKRAFAVLGSYSLENSPPVTRTFVHFNENSDHGLWRSFSAPALSCGSSSVRDYTYNLQSNAPLQRAMSSRKRQ